MSQTVATLDAKLRQALIFHQARRLAEAEIIYRQILALRPDMAEIRLNCALAQMGQRKYGDAEQALSAEAQDAFRRAVALAAGYVDARNGLGHALFKLGATQEAKAQ